MKYSVPIFIFFLAGICCLYHSSCIKPPIANPEADIESFIIPDAAKEAEVFIDQANRKIHLYLTREAFLHGVVPEIITSEGATVTPASGDSLHFGKAVFYTVTAANGVNKKTYEILVSTPGSWYFDFENWGLHAVQQYEFPETEGSTSFWATANGGVALAGVSKNPESYPTRSTSESYSGTKAAALVTLPGTSLSKTMGIHLFAGSLFTGVFDIAISLSEPLKASQFGQPFHDGKPIRFTGYYKYQSGNTYQDENGNPIPGRKDSCSLYAIVFKGTERVTALEIDNDPRIIARADIQDGSDRTSWTYFDIPFEYTSDLDINTPFMVAIVASSSKNGAAYQGATGSRLLLDQLQIVHE